MTLCITTIEIIANDTVRVTDERGVIVEIKYRRLSHQERVYRSTRRVIDTVRSFLSFVID